MSEREKLALDGFAADLSAAMDACGVTVRGLAKELGVDKSAISRARTGKPLQSDNFIALWNWLASLSTEPMAEEGGEAGMRETMWAKVIYEGEDNSFRFELTEEGNRDGVHYDRSIEFSADTFPVGTRIVVYEPDEDGEAVSSDLAADRRNELEEIADGAWGDNPMTRGLARDRLAASPAPAQQEGIVWLGMNWRGLV